MRKYFLGYRLANEAYLRDPPTDRPPLFFVADPEYATILGPDWPVVLLPAWPMMRDETVDAAADEYLSYVERLQPSGPYLFGGYCNAGWIAHEMARRLIARGEQVALLAIVEPAHTRMAAPMRLARRIAQMFGDPASFFRWPTVAMRDRLRKMQEADWAPDDYKVRPYAGPVELICARESPARYFPRFGWSRDVEGPVSVYRANGDHDTVLVDPSLRAILLKLIGERGPFAPIAAKRSAEAAAGS